MKGLSKERRNHLRRVMPRLRSLIEDAYTKRLAGLGIFPQCEEDHEHRIDCYISPEDSLNLKEEDKKLRKKIIIAIEREKKELTQPEPEKTRLGVERFIRQSSSTLINRLATLKAMELRRILKHEIITRRKNYGGLSQLEYLISQEDPSLSRKEILLRALKEGFQEASKHIGMIFDPADPYGQILPDTRELEDILGIINTEIREEDWLADDILGWIYQFWNEEERKAYRTGRGRGSRKAPDPDEIPVINQLYTPHWVVRTLVDNTLGRLWLDIKERKIPNRSLDEIFEEPEGESVDEFCKYLVPHGKDNNARVSKKHPSEIKILDPACGSGHFLIYSFDVLWRIWKEEEPDMPDEEIASNILEHNLYGVDIDLRATQLAALGLYLKAASYAPNVRVRKMNIVCADARLLDGERKEKFLNRFNDDLKLRVILERTLEDLKHPYEIGSLYRIREQYERYFEESKELMQKVRQASHLENPDVLLPVRMTLEDILSALEEFEKEALDTRNIGNLLFAADAKRSVGLLSILTEKYDVVLMNPPYGDVPPRAKEYLREWFPKTHKDVYSAFIEQAVDLTGEGGYVGMLTNLTFMYLSSHRWLREELFPEKAPPVMILEFGLGILDGASVYTAGTVLKRSSNGIENDTLFIRLTEPPTEEKEHLFREALGHIHMGRKHPEVFWASLQDLAQIPGSPYAYWTTPSIRALFSKYPPLDRDVAKRPDQPKIADVKQGLATADDSRFTRRWWEVDGSLFAKSREDTLGGKKWVPFAKGEEYARYYADISLVVNWERDGEEIRNYRDSRGKLLSRPQNESFYFREGLTWQFSNVLWYSRFRYLPPQSIFSVASHGCFPVKNNSKTRFGLLGILNSSLFNLLIIIVKSDDRNWHIGYIAPLPIPLNFDQNARLSELSKAAYSLLREWDTGNETSTIFIKPWIAQVAFGWNPDEKPKTGHPFAENFKWSDWEFLKEIREITGNPEMPLKELAKLTIERERRLTEKLAEIQREIDEEVYRIYEISEEDRKLIERELERMKKSGDTDSEEIVSSQHIPPEIRRLFPPMKSPKPVDEEEHIREHVRRLLSWYIKRAIEKDKEGIVQVYPPKEDSLENSVRTFMGMDWGKERTLKLLDEIEEILGMPLSDWILWEYFPYHRKLYKNRPIFWLLWSSGKRKGKRKRKPAFAAFLHYHRLTSDTISRVITLYVDPLIKMYKARVDRYYLKSGSDQGEFTTDMLMQIDEIKEIIAELEDFKERLETLTRPYQGKPRRSDWLSQKVYEVRKNGYAPNIDYGVLVNMTPLKEADVLHKDAEGIK